MLPKDSLELLRAAQNITRTVGGGGGGWGVRGAGGRISLSACQGDRGSPWVCKQGVHEGGKLLYAELPRNLEMS